MKVLLVILIMMTLAGYALQLAYEQLCLRVNEGFLRHPYDCHKFIRCSHQRSYEFQCPANLLWHHEIKTCDFSYRTPCKLNQQNNNMTSLKQIVENKRRKQINLGKKLLKENQNYTATKRDTDLLPNAVKAVTESRLTGIATNNTTKQLTSPAIATASITNEMVTENTPKTVTETSFSSSLKLNKNKLKNFNNTREPHKSFHINELQTFLTVTNSNKLADKENKAEHLSIKKNDTHQHQLNSFTATEQMLTENYIFSLNSSTTLENLTYSINLTQPHTSYTFGEGTKSSLSALSTALQRENETFTTPLITENFIQDFITNYTPYLTTEQQLNTVNLTEVTFENNVTEISTFISEKTLNVLQVNNVATLTAVTRNAGDTFSLKEKSKENDNINSILMYANDQTNENNYQQRTTEMSFAKNQTVDSTEINSEIQELTAATTAFNHTARGFVNSHTANSKEIFNKNLLTENGLDITTDNFPPTRATSFDDLTGLTSNNITERRLTNKASTNLTITKSPTSIPTSTTLHEYEYLPHDDATKDPRLPFRSKECQGPNNRQCFKANKCYQYYQCFAGWAFLLNCHDGWMFQIKERKCILDVRQECNFE